jgi:hypothetical protein
VEFFWGDDLLDTTQGLDILGVRGLDQSIEIRLVNGITTISQRARYLSILTWSIGDFLVERASDGFDWPELEAFLRRVEFLVLAATRLDRDNNGGDATGTLGANLHFDAIQKLLDGELITIPDDRGGAMLGTYFTPCKAVGLLTEGDEIIPYKLTPRGKTVWELRKVRIEGAPIRQLLHQGGQLTKFVAEAAIPEFSLGALKDNHEEAAILRAALTVPWEPSDETSRARVSDAYNAVNGTINWVAGLLEKKPDNAVGIIVRNFHRCIERRVEDRISLSWAEYEYRRRCHLSLELLLSALTAGLADHEEATIAQVIDQWSKLTDFTSFLTALWPAANDVWSMAAAEARDTVPRDLFADAQMPTKELRSLPPADQALIAVAILSATTNQTHEIRKAGLIDLMPTSPGERAISLIEEAQDSSFQSLLEKLIGLASLSHLQTTLRKMGSGQLCSLRFFPEGPSLRPTGLGMTPGHSGDRLTNVLKILADVGALDRTNNGFVPSGRAA